MTPLLTLRWASRIEGVSLLLLLFVAVPLKHVFGIPLAVRIAGTVHGVLFVVLVSSAFRARVEDLLPTSRVARVLGWSLVPFGFVAAERALRP